MTSDIQFRTWDLERKDIRERNIEKTLTILEQAEITPDNPSYKRYYNATMVNVNNAYRFSYNGETDAMLDKVLDEFAATIKDPNVSIDDYEAVTKEFLHQRVASQFQHADGSYAYDATYEDMRKTLNETIQSGMDMRKEKGTVFPKEFYTENGSLQRIVLDIPPEMQQESAMRNIDMIVAKYKDKGIDFSSAENAFIVKGQKVGPEKFFTSKSSRLNGFLEKFEKDVSILDVNDRELFDILEKDNYEEFLELGKKRGMARDKTNEALRAALKDEIVFHEICAGGNTNSSTIISKIRDLSQNFTNTAQLVSKESEKAVLGRIDRVMFSVVPEDLATQSTLRNWKSCMHTTGCNHQFVDDSIGLGSIIAYGYDSQNPQKPVSRLLIHPYYDESGNIAYKVNDRIYGKDNTGFRRAVESATHHFNEGKLGFFELAEGLYNDNGGISRMYLMRRDAQGRINFEDIVKNNQLELKEVNFRDIIKSPQEVFVPENVSVIIRNSQFLDGMDFSKATSVNIGSWSIEYQNIKLPNTIIISESIPDGMDLSNIKNLVLCKNVTVGKDVKLPENTIFLANKSGRIADNVDLSSVDNLILEGDWKICQNVQLPDNTTLNNATISGEFPKVKKMQLAGKNIFRDITVPVNCDINEIFSYSDMERCSFEGKCHFAEGVNLPYTMNFKDAVVSGDLSNAHGGVNFTGRCYIETDKLPTTCGVYFKDAEVLSGDFTGRSLHIEGKTSFADNVKLSDNISFANAEIADGTILDNMKNLDVSNSTIGKNVKITHKVKYSFAEFDNVVFSSGCDLTDCNKMICRGSCEFASDVAYPNHVEFSNAVLKGDLSQLNSVSFSNNIEILPNTQLPKEVDITGYSECSVKGDLSSAEHLILRSSSEIDLGQVKGYPKTVTFEGKIPNGIDLRQVEHLNLSGEISIGENVKLADNVEITLKNTQISKDFNFEQYKNIHFEGISIANDTESLQKLLSSDAKCIYVEKQNITSDIKLPSDKAMLIVDSDGKALTYLPDEKAKKELMTALKISDEQVFDKEANVVSKEEFTKRSGIEFTETKSLKVEQHVAEVSAMKTINETTIKSAEGVATEAVENAATKSVASESAELTTTATGGTATKTAMKASAAASFDAAKKAKAASKAKNTLLAANKSYDDAFDALMKWGDKHAPQWMNRLEEKTVQKAAEKFMKTKSGQAIAKQIEKKVGKEVAASIAKKIPLLCIGVGAYCVYDRLKDGEYMKAVGEGVSALVSNVPGLGTLAGAGIDSVMLSDDLKVFEHGIMPKNLNSHMAAESTFVERQIVPEKIDRVAASKAQAEKEKKKKEKEKKKAQQFENNLYRYGKPNSFFER